MAAAQKAISAAVIRTISTSGDLRNLEKTVDQIEQASGLSPVERRLPLIAGWEGAVEQLLDDELLDDNEERLLFAFKERFELSQTDLDRNGALTKTAKAAFLRNLLKGEIPQRTSFREELPINFQKNEKIVWVFPNSKYLEDKTRRQYVGGSHGVSIRVMKGLYYRVGAFKGQAVESTERVYVDTGWVVITDQIGISISQAPRRVSVYPPRRSFRSNHSAMVLA